MGAKWSTSHGACGMTWSGEMRDKWFPKKCRSCRTAVAPARRGAELTAEREETGTIQVDPRNIIELEVTISIRHTRAQKKEQNALRRMRGRCSDRNVPGMCQKTPKKNKNEQVQGYLQHVHPLVQRACGRALVITSDRKHQYTAATDRTSSVRSMHAIRRAPRAHHTARWG